MMSDFDIGELNKTHGMTKSKTYNSWRAMKERCYNPKNKRYNSYGASGIVVCDRWLNSFENFLEDMGERPENTTLERINVKGNYEVENCKWENPTNQAFNISRKSNNSSGRTGVNFNKKLGKYTACISKNNIQFHLGVFETFEEAVLAREKAEIQFYGYCKE